MTLIEQLKSAFAVIIAIIGGFIGYRISESKRDAEQLQERINEQNAKINSIKESADIDKHVDSLSDDAVAEQLRKYNRD